MDDIAIILRIASGVSVSWQAFANRALSLRRPERQPRPVRAGN